MAILLMMACGEETFERKLSTLVLDLYYFEPEYYPTEIAIVNSLRIVVYPYSTRSPIISVIDPRGGASPVEIRNGETADIRVEARAGQVAYFSGSRYGLTFPVDADRKIEIVLFDVLPPSPPTVPSARANEAPYYLEGFKEHGTAILLGGVTLTALDEFESFGAFVPLKPGPNPLELRAVDRAGNYSDPATVSIDFRGPAGCADFDGDGFNDELCGGFDCNDDDPLVAPYLRDEPYDGIDSDCIGGDNLDGDGDGYDFYLLGGDDCDDDDPSVFPGAVEYCGDGVDSNCDGRDPACDDLDVDGDGLSLLGGDCDDSDPAVRPGRVETPYNGRDDDCDPTTPDDDLDGDGFRAEFDCDDADPNSSPGLFETFGDEIDQNCDGVTE